MEKHRSLYTIDIYMNLLLKIYKGYFYFVKYLNREQGHAK